MRSGEGLTQDHTAPQRRRPRVVLVPPIPWQPGRAAHLPGSGPDPVLLERILQQEGIETALADPLPRPWNPLAGPNTVLQALDPLRALSLLARERRADLILSVFEAGAAPLLFARRLLGFRPLIALWDIGLVEGWAMRERVLDFVVPRCDAILVLNSSQVDYIRRRWRPRGEVITIGHSVDTAFYRPSPSKPPETAPVLAVGEDHGRDFATLVEAMRGQGTRLLIKTRREVPSAPELTVLKDRMSFLELRRLYEECLFVAVPLKETLNASGVSTILEAGAMGKAMVVTESAAIRDFILPGETCLAVPPGDVAAMRRAVATLRADPELRRRLGETARSFVEARCSVPVFATRLAATLRRLLEGRNSARGQTDAR